MAVKNYEQKRNTATCNSYILRFADLKFMFLSFHGAGG